MLVKFLGIRINNKMDNLSAVTKVIGIGGAGINMVSGVCKNDPRRGADLIAIDTDWRALNNSPVRNKIFLDVRPFQRGLSGFSPSALKSAFDVSLNCIGEAVRGASYVILAAGLGGMTGNIATPLISSFLKELGLPIIGIFTTPFPFEGKKRTKKAREIIDVLKKCLNTSFTFPNQDIMKVTGENISLEEACKSSNVLLSQVLYNLLRAFPFLETCISLGFAQMMLSEAGGIGYIGIDRKGKRRELCTGCIKKRNTAYR